MKTFNREKIQALAEKHQLQLLLLFGSQVSGKTHPGSDHDFAFLSVRDFDFGDRARLRDDLTNLVDFETSVEEVDLKEAQPFLLKEILINHQVLLNIGSSYEEFYSYAFRTVLDSQRLFDLQSALYQKTVNKYRHEYAE
jgi:predicted nucleotidyltransferase